MVQNLPWPDASLEKTWQGSRRHTLLLTSAATAASTSRLPKSLRPQHGHQVPGNDLGVGVSSWGHPLVCHLKRQAFKTGSHNDFQRARSICWPLTPSSWETELCCEAVTGTDGQAGGGPQ